MFDIWKYLSKNEYKDKVDNIIGHLVDRYPPGTDPWGLDLDKLKQYLPVFWYLYKDYFKIRVFGSENVKDTNYFVVANHSGQIALDGILIWLAFFGDVNPPRLLRPMAEKFVSKLPFLSQMFAEAGTVLGDRENCKRLIDRNESILVFPEGVRGIIKNTSDFYKLQKFTRGFFRLALVGNTEILPVAVIGAEEFYPYVFHFRPLARAFGLPGFPLTPGYFLGPLGLLPLPSPVDIYIGPSYKIPKGINSDSPDETIKEHINNIMGIIEKMIKEGRKNRRPFWANKEME